MFVCLFVCVYVTELLPDHKTNRNQTWWTYTLGSGEHLREKNFEIGPTVKEVRLTAHTTPPFGAKPKVLKMDSSHLEQRFSGSLSPKTTKVLV